MTTQEFDDPNELTQIGPYPVNRFVAEGEIAWVFEVVDTRFDVRRALRMLKPAATEGTDFQRFQSEAGQLAAIDHPNLIRVYDFGRDEATGCYYYTMTFVDGPPLSKRGVLAAEVACPLYLDVLAGIATLHDRGIIHRDIKPANILLTSDGRALVADLGISRRADEAGVTRTNVSIGSALCMAPEQAHERDLSFAVDVFATGLSLYHTLTGRSIYDTIEDVDPSSGEDLTRYLGSLIDAGRELDFDSPPEISPAIREVIVHACRLRPSDRYPDARAMHDALYDAFYREAATPSRKLTRLSPSILAGIAAALVTVAGIGVWLSLPDPAESEAAELLDRVDDLERRAASLIFSSARLDPQPPTELLAQLGKEVAGARTFRTRAWDDYQDDRYSSARDLLLQAHSAYNRACARLTNQHLHARADELIVPLLGRADIYRKAGAAELLPEHWPDVEASLVLVSPPDGDLEGCGVAEIELGRIGAFAQADALMSVAEAELEDDWPRLAGLARGAAEDAHVRVSEESVIASEFDEALEQGRSRLSEGAVEMETEDYLGALESFRSAEEHFRIAAAIVPAAQARTRAQSLDERARVIIDDLGVVDTEIAEANRLWEARLWEESASYFTQSIELLESLLANLEASRSALAAAQISKRARRAAVAAEAKLSSADALAAADGIHHDATKALVAEDYEASEQGFRAAAEAYRGVEEQTLETFEQARSSRERAYDAQRLMQAVGECAALSESARMACDMAVEALQAGEESLESHIGSEALASFQIADDRFRVAVENERVYQEKLPRPPVLVSRTPAASRVKIYRNEEVVLKVEASDPNGDALHYTWSVDGTQVEESGPRFASSFGGDASISVRVDDGKKGHFTERWKLVLVAR